MADDSNPGYATWLNGIRAVAASAEQSREWREERYRFAHQLGNALVAEREGLPPVIGHALYGIWLPWGLLYVGQTGEASRRLKDLPVGESHHLANTFPPEIWDRVVVVSWSRLPEADEVVALLGAKTVGLALEHHPQLHAKPLFNGVRRTTAGGWREVNLGRSKSAGALAARHVDALALRVIEIWNEAAVVDSLTAAVRVIRPSAFLRPTSGQTSS